MVIAVVPISVGAALIRPALNSLITKRVASDEYGRALGVSSALVSAANAVAPLLAGLLFQALNPNAPFVIGGALMAGLCALSVLMLRSGGR
jgi:MFS family permease